MGTRSQWKLVVPTLRGSSQLQNPLTKEEKEYFEKELGQKLGVYDKPCYWSNNTPGAWNSVTLKKSGLVLDLRNVKDYLQWCILRLHKDLIASSIQEMEDHPRATQMFYMVNEKDETMNRSKKANMKYEAFTKYGKIKDEEYILRYIVFVLDGRNPSRSTDVSELQGKVTSYIDESLSTFLNIVDDPMLSSKALLHLAAEKKLVNCNNGLYFTKDTNEKMALNGEDPRINAAAKWLNAKENKDVLFDLQKKLL
jgi:hypothetical protein